MATAADDDIIDVLYKCRRDGKEITDAIPANFFREQQQRKLILRQELAKTKEVPEESPIPPPPPRCYQRDLIMMRRFGSSYPTEPEVFKFPPEGDLIMYQQLVPEPDIYMTPTWSDSQTPPADDGREIYSTLISDATDNHNTAPEELATDQGSGKQVI